MKRLISFIAFVSLAVIAFATGHDHAGASIAGFAPVGTYVCQKLQTDLELYYGKNLAKFRTLGSTALIKWLLSPQNRSGFQQINVESIPGKKRGIAFKVDAPYCFELCRLNVDCTNEDIVYSDPETKEIVFDLNSAPFRHCDDEGNPVLLRFTEEDMMKYCTISDTSWMQEQIFRYLLRFEEALDKALSVALNTVVGTNGSGQSITDIPLFTSGNTFTPNMSVLNPEGMWYVNQVYNDIGNEGQFALIGGTIMNKIIQFNKWVGLNAAGVDMSKADPINPYPFYDRNFNTVFGQSDIILLAPGTVQLVTWNKYKGEKRRAVTNLYTKSTVVLPNTGLEVDYKWKYDPDCEIFTFEAFLHAELASNIPGGCGENAEGINGIIRIHDCGAQPIIPACAESGSSGSGSA